MVPVSVVKVHSVCIKYTMSDNPQPSGFSSVLQDFSSDFIHTPGSAAWEAFRCCPKRSSL